MNAVVVSTHGLTKRFGPVTALAALDLDVKAGEVLGVLGPNGAGKTTLVRLLLGMLRPTAGRAVVFGLNATRDAARAHRRLAYVPGETALWPELTGAQTLHLLGRLHGTIDERYRDELVSRFEIDLARRMADCSKGNRQKIALVAALMTRADLLVLDEPTSGLDPLMERQFRRAVAEAAGRGQTVLLSSHLLGEVEALCDRVAILRAGKLVDLGSLSELRHLSALEVSATFAGPPPDLSAVPGVAAVSADGSTVSFRLRGPMEPLLRVLAGHKVITLLSREPSLEELFLAHYGAAPAAVSVPPPAAAPPPAATPPAAAPPPAATPPAAAPPLPPPLPPPARSSLATSSQPVPARRAGHVT